MLRFATACALILAGSLAPGDRLGAQVPKVLIVGIDGCRPDAMRAASTPNLDALIDDGAVSYEAQTGDITSSGPGWSSLLCGVWRDKHGVTNNNFTGDNYDDYPHFFTRVKEAFPDKVTASIVHWGPINDFILRDADISSELPSDAQVSAAVANLLATGDPDVVFLHFDEVDGAGHSCCYSPENASYLREIEEKDRQLGPVLEAMRARASFAEEDWLVLVSTDHGGTGTGHGQNIPEHRTIFYIASGPSACRGELLEAPGIVDVAVTALAHLGVALDESWNLDGVPRGFDACASGRCLRDFSCRAELESGRVELAWDPVEELEVNALELHRNGELLAVLAPDIDTYVDELVLDGAAHPSLRYELFVGPGEGVDCPPLACTLRLSTGRVVFAEDFDDFASDRALEAAGWRIVDVNDPVEDSTWTLSNPGARANPPTVDGTASSGGFLISDSDAQAESNPSGTGMSHDVWSPVFDCSALDQVFLHCDVSAQLNNNGAAVFDVDVAIDGARWRNVFRRVAPSRDVAPFPTVRNADGFFGRLDLDLTSVAAGEESVRVRWRHFEPNFDWWIALDNVVVDDVDLLSGGSIEVLEAESFDAGIPRAWTLRSGEGNRGQETWHTSDKGSRYVRGRVSERGVNRLEHPGIEPAFAMLDSDADPDPAEDEYLVTPSLDCRELARVWLHFESEIVPSATEEVLLSLDGGETFLEEPIFSFAAGGLLDPGEEPFFAERVLELPRAAGEARVAIAFHCLSDGNAWWWAIDEVRVTGAGETIDPSSRQRPGDCNQDGVLDISDGICLLGFLFGGAGPGRLPCGEGGAGEAGNLELLSFNGDGEIDISDAVSLLANLFLGGPGHPQGADCQSVASCPDLGASCGE